MAQSTLVKSGAVHSGWKQCILVKRLVMNWEFVPPYIILLDPDYVAACLLHSLCSNYIVIIWYITRKFVFYM